MATKEQKNQIEQLDHVLQIYFKLGNQAGERGSYISHVSKVRWEETPHGMAPVQMPLEEIPTTELCYMLTLAMQKFLQSTGKDGMYKGEIRVGEEKRNEG